MSGGINSARGPRSTRGGLVGILDADREGFAHQTSLIQTIGRAARNADGRVILYADKRTKSIVAALEETQRRRQLQLITISVMASCLKQSLSQ